MQEVAIYSSGWIGPEEYRNGGRRLRPNPTSLYTKRGMGHKLQDVALWKWIMRQARTIVPMRTHLRSNSGQRTRHGHMPFMGTKRCHWVSTGRSEKPSASSAEALEVSKSCTLLSRDGWLLVLFGGRVHVTLDHRGPSTRWVWKLWPPSVLFMDSVVK